MSHSKDIYSKDLTGSPLIDKLDFTADLFGDLSDIATSLSLNGYAILPIEDPNWIKLVDDVRSSLIENVDTNLFDNSDLRNVRFQDAWLHLKLEKVRQLAIHPEIIDKLSRLYGREAFPFQTLNFPFGSEQAIHSDSVHFNSIPFGFMCGVWVSLEDIHIDSGPLKYYPGSHRLPYLTARDLGISNNQINSCDHPQVLFEKEWEKSIDEGGYNSKLFIASKGQVLIWHANLLHGGSPINNLNLTRWSQVSHYFFRKCFYMTPINYTIDNYEEINVWRDPFDLTNI